MESTPLSTLIRRYLNEELSEEETRRLWETLREGEGQEQWEEALLSLLQDKQLHGHADPARMEQVYASIRPAGTPVVPMGRHRWLIPAVAAVALTIIITSAVFWLSGRRQQPLAKHTPVPAHEVMPGSNKATLTLADGSTITLDSAGNGALAQQGNVQVVQVDSGQLAYKASGSHTGGALQYNTLAIPRGGQFRVTLPDGTKVWINAASTLRYPTAFSGRDRTVQLTGEAYFEVAPMPNKPFHVKLNNMDIQVLGTHFNVMAYTEEATIRTTLLEGAVKIDAAGAQTPLRPGQQLRLDATGQLAVVNNVDVDEIVAWKNGYFQFNHEKLPGVMRQIARWYDVEVAYEGHVPDREFGGKISRNSSIEEVLKILELSKIHVRLEKKKIIVIP
ncbi:FecR family protein [Chitinophaga qingshengii]|uniref:FecR domain-containing protein n=1 Tax=Chitinophaga qingshengii TaxID=1569794 RepID=A0ABR7TLT6_9BACT|nr:FecR family protein [Chitinophaga qingshengii]MBC9930933.1 FecR domain-containing protein [Chitinophaga qingshengii]